MTLQALITWLIKSDHVTEHALITWLSCTDDVPAHALMTWLIGYTSHACWLPGQRSWWKGRCWPGSRDSLSGNDTQQHLVPGKAQFTATVAGSVSLARVQLGFTTEDRGPWWVALTGSECRA